MALSFTARRAIGMEPEVITATTEWLPLGRILSSRRRSPRSAAQPFSRPICRDTHRRLLVIDFALASLRARKTRSLTRPSSQLPSCQLRRPAEGLRSPIARELPAAHHIGNRKFRTHAISSAPMIDYFLAGHNVIDAVLLFHNTNKLPCPYSHTGAQEMRAQRQVSPCAPLTYMATMSDTMSGRAKPERASGLYAITTLTMIRPPFSFEILAYHYLHIFKFLDEARCSPLSRQTPPFESSMPFALRHHDD